MTAPPDPDPFIARWQDSSAAERANYQLFPAELCDLLGVERPEPARADPERNRYAFEHPVTFRHPDGSTSRLRRPLPPTPWSRSAARGASARTATPPEPPARQGA